MKVWFLDSKLAKGQKGEGNLLDLHSLEEKAAV